MESLRQRCMWTAAVIAVAVGVGMAPLASGQTTRKLVYATYIPDTLSIVQADKWFMDEVTRRTNGRITFEVYLSGALLKAGDILPGVAAGAADLGMSVPSAYNRKDYPLSNITLPFITDKVDSASYAFKEMYESNADLRKEYEGRGLKLLYAPAAGENTMWSVKPIAKPDAALMDYVLTADDGTVLDSSENHGGAQPFSMEQVFPGFAEAMTRMQEGGQYRFSMPQRLAFGDSPAPPGFPKNSKLNFEVRVRKVVRGGAALMQQQMQEQQQQQMQQAPQQ